MSDSYATPEAERETVAPMPAQHEAEPESMESYAARREAEDSQEEEGRANLAIEARGKDPGEMSMEEYSAWREDGDDAALAEAPAPKPQAQPEAGAAGEVQWTTAEVQKIQQIRQAEAEFNRDLQAFANAKAAFEENKGTLDKGRAAALSADLKAAEEALQANYEALTGEAQPLLQKVQNHHQGAQQRLLKAEREKLESTIPNLDKKALVGYLKNAGFDEADIKSAADARLVILAEKARRFDAGETPAKKKVIPTVKKSAVEASTPSWQGKSIEDMTMHEYAAWHDAGRPGVQEAYDNRINAAFEEQERAKAKAQRESQEKFQREIGDYKAKEAATKRRFTKNNGRA